MKIKCYTTGIFCTILMLMMMNVHGQSANKLIRAADRAYAGMQYNTALDLYQQAYRQDSSGKHVIKRVAWLYQSLKDDKNSLQWFNKLDFNKEPPSWLLLYIQSLAANEQYERADSCLRVYRSRVQDIKTDLDYNKVNDLFRDSAQWKIAYASINSSLDEFSGTMYGNSLVFVTNQYLPTAIKRVDRRDDHPFLQLRRVTDTAKIQYTPVQDIDMKMGNTYTLQYIFNDDDTRPTSNDSKVTGVYRFRYQAWKGIQRPGWNNGVGIFDNHIESRYHEGPVTFSPKFDTVYFTRNNFVPGKYRTDKAGINRLKIYRAVYHNGGWNDIDPLPINDDEYSTAHPALSPDGSILFFVSDMPGGFGGKDLYYIRREQDGSWSKPVNAGNAVNTTGDELFPFIDRNNVFYFSSNGRPGLGGLDIYRTRWNGQALEANPQNMGYPLNTSRDDFGIWCTSDKDGMNGFLSSNRYGDDDLFRFHYKPLRLQVTGTVYATPSGLRYPDVKVVLVSKDERKDTVTDITGNFQWQLLPETDYELVAVKNGISGKVIPFSTKGITSDSIIHKDLYLVQRDSSTYHKPNCDSVKKYYTIPDIHYDLDKSALRTDALPALQQLVALLQKDTSLQVIISSYTDARASRAYNNKLSARRSATVAEYLLHAGIPAARFTTEYYGETRLKNGCKDAVPCPEYLHQANRRTEFYIIRNGVNITLECP